MPFSPVKNHGGEGVIFYKKFTERRKICLTGYLNG